jgi:hypothetical protein
MRHTYEYSAMTKDECNRADGRFSTASTEGFLEWKGRRTLNPEFAVDGHGKFWVWVASQKSFSFIYLRIVCPEFYP